MKINDLLNRHLLHLRICTFFKVRRNEDILACNFPFYLFPNYDCSRVPIFKCLPDILSIKMISVALQLAKK